MPCPASRVRRFLLAGRSVVLVSKGWVLAVERLLVPLGALRGPGLHLVGSGPVTTLPIHPCLPSAPGLERRCHPTEASIPQSGGRPHRVSATELVAVHQPLIGTAFRIAPALVAHPDDTASDLPGSAGRTTPRLAPNPPRALLPAAVAPVTPDPRSEPSYLGLCGGAHATRVTQSPRRADRTPARPPPGNAGPLACSG